MLHKGDNIILPETLSLLSRLQKDPMLNQFFLVGGTALAMQIGHRYSVDLDFFTLVPFDTQHLTEHLSEFHDFQLNSVQKNTVLGLIEGVKTDFITHAYPLVDGLVEEDGLRMASIEDIGAMKLNAIAHSGQRLKNFIDIYFLLELLPVNTLLKAYELKYPNSNLLVPLKGLIYFEDIDLEADPPILNRKVDIVRMKKRLSEAVENTQKIF